MILGADGKPVSAETLEAEACPTCGASPEHWDVQPPGFGGYFKTVCKACGTVLAQGRKIPMEV
jgi:hypothetical protein